MTIKQIINQELQKHGDWIFAGQLARIIANRERIKESNVERRCRELANVHAIERREVVNPNGGNKVVQYRVKFVKYPARSLHDKQLSLI